MTAFFNKNGNLKVEISTNEIFQTGFYTVLENYKSLEAKIVLIKIFNEASKQIGFQMKESSLKIRIYLNYTGFIIYFIPKKASKTLLYNKLNGTPYIFEFKSSKDMLNAIEQIYRIKSPEEKSSLYLCEDGKYRLVLTDNTDDSKRIMIAGEYANKQLKGINHLIYTQEHCKQISANNALSEIGKIMFDK